MAEIDLFDAENMFAEGEDRSVPAWKDMLAPQATLVGAEEYMCEMEYALRHLETTAVKLREQLLSMKASRFLLDGIRGADDEYRKDDLYRFEKDLYGITVMEEENGIRITLPALLPHRKKKPESPFIKPLYTAIRNFLEEGKGKAYLGARQNGVFLIIKHTYIAAWMVRDHDNVEIKKAIDTLVVSGLLQKDEGGYLSILSTADMAELGRNENRTELLLLPKSEIRLEAGNKEVVL